MKGILLAGLVLVCGTAGGTAPAKPAPSKPAVPPEVTAAM